MPATAAIIINRNAGGLRRDPRLLERLRERAQRVLPVHVTEDLPALRAVCEGLARDQVSVVGVVGGDGSASASLTALWRAYGAKLPRIALLRGGSMNTVATSLGTGRGSALQLLERMFAQLRSPELQRTRTRPVMRFNGDRLGFLFGTGVWYGYLAETYRDGPPSFPIYVSVLGRLFASAAVNGEMVRRVARPAPTEVRFRQGAWPSQAYLSIAAGTVADVGFGFQPFHQAFVTEDCFQLLAIRGSARDVLASLPDLRSGRGFSDRVARQITTDYAELHAEQGFIEYSIDGDVDTLQGALRIELGPRFEFLCL